MAVGAVLVAGTVALTGCGDQPGAAAPVSPAGSTAAATGSTAGTPDELRDALLPASAFGSDATVGGLSVEQLGDLPVLAGLPGGATVAPPLCAAALSLPGVSGGQPALAATAAYTDTARSLEVLADGPALDGLRLPVDELLAACSTVTVTGSDGAATTVSLSELAVPELGDAAAGLTVTVTGAEPGGLGRSGSALVGLVSQGSRAVLLAQTGTAGAVPDAGDFTALLSRAAEAATR
jgi:hypothetical protein